MARSDAIHFAHAGLTMLGDTEKICQQTQAVHCPSLGGTENCILYAAIYAAMYAYY